MEPGFEEEFSISKGVDDSLSDDEEEEEGEDEEFDEEEMKAAIKQSKQAALNKNEVRTNVNEHTNSESAANLH